MLMGQKRVPGRNVSLHDHAVRRSSWGKCENHVKSDARARHLVWLLFYTGYTRFESEQVTWLLLSSKHYPLKGSSPLAIRSSISHPSSTSDFLSCLSIVPLLNSSDRVSTSLLIWRS